MRAGKKRHRVTIQQSTPATSSSGEVTLTWATFATVFLESRQTAGGETEIAEAGAAEAEYVFSTRWTPGVTPEMRIVMTLRGSTRTFEINRVDDVQLRGIEMHLYCTEAAN